MLFEIDPNALSAFQAVRSDMTDWARELCSEKDQKKWGIDGSTFRAFRGHSKPSLGYREWAKATFNNLANEPHNPDVSFQKLHASWVCSISQTWQDKSIGFLKFHQPRKLVDLFTKHIARHPELGLPWRDFFMKNGHVPLDKYSLLAVAEFYPGLVMPENPSMQHISSQAKYDASQMAIKEVTQAASVPNLFFDWYAWDRFH